MNIKKLKPFLLNNSLEKNIFYVSIFLLPSAPFFSSLILFFLGIKLSFKNKTYFSDKWNIPFFYAGLLIVFSCLSNFISRPFYNQPYQSSLIWIEYSIGFLIFGFFGFSAIHRKIKGQI